MTFIEEVSESFRGLGNALYEIFIGSDEEEELIMDTQSPEHTHEWEMWEIQDEGNLVDPDDEDHVVGRFLDQRRQCSTCGKYEISTETSYI